MRNTSITIHPTLIQQKATIASMSLTCLSLIPVSRCSMVSRQNKLRSVLILSLETTRNLENSHILGQ
jgi:hypothetical protein